MTSRTHIQQLIQNGRTEEAIRATIDFAHEVGDEFIKDQVSLLSGDFQNAHTAFKGGRIAENEFEQKQNKVHYALLDWLSKLPETLAPKKRLPGLLSPGDNRLIADQRDVYGRETEIQKVLDFLDSNAATAQVTAQITGTGGIGKTEICKRALQTWLDKHPDSTVYWVGLNDGASPAECALEVAKALGHDNLPSPDHLYSLLQPGIYYLDNLESLDNDEGNALLSKIARTPGVRLLASSRVPLAALGKPIETNILPLPAALTTFCEAWTGSETLPHDETLTRFVEKDLGCHALSLVLMAALGEVKSLERQMQDWRQKGVNIARQAHDPTRRGSLMKTLHMSSDVVSATPGALSLWTVAALFPDGLSESVLDWVYAHNTDIKDDSLQVLVRHRIMKRQGDRYHLLPPVARFALDEARVESGGFSWAATVAAIEPYFAELVRNANHTISTQEVLAAKAILMDNFTSVHRFVLEACSQESLNGEMLAFYANGLRNKFQFYIVLGREMLQQLHPALLKTDMVLHTANALQVLGDLEFRLGKVERAKSLYEQAILLFKKEQSDLGLANTLRALGELGSRLGQVERAKSLFEQAIKLYEKVQSDLGLANTLRALGELESRLGQVEHAKSLFEQAIKLYEKVQDDLGLANALKALGELESRLGQVEHAKSLFEQAIKLYKNEQFNLGLANALLDLGELELRLGQVERAKSLFGQAIELYKKEQDYLGLANALKALGELERLLGQIERAKSLYEQAIKLYEKVQDDLGLANVLWALGNLEFNAEQPAMAVAQYNKALALYVNEQEPVGQINTCISMARLVQQYGPQGDDLTDARGWYERALAVAEGTGVAYYIEVVKGIGQELGLA